VDSTEVIAIAGIVGTLAGTAGGAGIAAWTSSRLEKRRERREEKAEARKARAAARMIRADLVVSAATIQGVVNSDVLDPTTMYLPLDNWRVHGERLALALEDGADWNRIERAMAGVLERLSEAKTQWQPGPLPPSVKERLRNLHATLMEAERTLAPLAGDPEARPAADTTK
jgi:hypothetical protein